MRPLTFFLLIATLVLAACAASLETGTALPLSQPTVAEGLAPTKTVIWFPATATETVFPTIEASATPWPFPGLGAQVFSDDFSDPKAWIGAKTQSNGGNSIILDRNRLTFAANIPPVALSSLSSSLILTDFYAEMNVSVNRCLGADAYGMLFRTASEAYTYRFLLNCTGKVRVERSRDGVTTPLQDWVPSGEAPPGAPGEVKMSIWAAGVEMRFFLNGRYQFTVIDPVFRNGALGAFVSAVSPDHAQRHRFKDAGSIPHPQTHAIAI
ncbi:MAG: hypothetical protein NT121_13130 [Chloroflexi bacterium]|nr:hypothetical protein [Chloroflexota bacterium]